MIFKNKKILPSITTLTPAGWQKKIKEIDKLSIKEVALFLTNVNPTQRKKLYSLLAKTKLQRIPFVHLRNDSDIKEIEFLIKRYKTKAFNIHSPWHSKYPLLFDLSKYKNKIYIENSAILLDLVELKNFSGLCLDFAHLEDERLIDLNIYRHNLGVVKRVKIGCAHISAISSKPKYSRYHHFRKAHSRRKAHYDWHFFKDLSEFDYLKKYPARYFPKIIALELENSLKDQLRAREYIIRIMNYKLRSM
ncbi:MAG: hypothetical protein AAB465_00840 [Patescibacteria group bacterium]